MFVFKIWRAKRRCETLWTLRELRRDILSHYLDYFGYQKQRPIHPCLEDRPRTDTFSAQVLTGSEVYASIRPLYARAHSKARLLGLSGVEAVIGV